MAYADEKLAVLLNAAPDAMVCVDGDGTITLANSRTAQLFGYLRDELVGQSVDVLVPPATRAEHARERARYLADPKPRPMGARKPLLGYRRDGSTFPAEISLSSVEIGDGVVVIAAVRDVTERLEAEAERARLETNARRIRRVSQVRRDREHLARQLHYLERMESLGQLAGGVAHDFNNLLLIISSHASLAGEDAARDEPAASWQSVRGHVEQIGKAVQMGSDLTRKLLAFARREVTEPRVIDINSIVAGLEDMLVRTLGEHIELVTVLAQDLCPVLADPGQLERVLINLAVNARDAMPAGGRLTVKTASIRLDGASAHALGLVGVKPGRYSSVEVSDTGTGIPQALMERVCEPFFTTKADGVGSGLGLSSVYGIVTQAGGTLRIRSQQGTGTTVTALLPVTDRLDPAGPVERSDGAGGGTEVVLVVDDEAAMREMTRRMLARNGYQVTAAADGHEAIELATSQRSRIDVLVANVVMSKMAGDEVAARIGAVQPGLRVLFTSGYDQDLLRAQGLLQAGGSFISRPFSERALLAKVREVLAAPR